MVPIADGVEATSAPYTTTTTAAGEPPLAAVAVGAAAVRVAARRLHRAPRRPFHAGPAPPVGGPPQPILRQVIGPARAAAAGVGQRRRSVRALRARADVADAPLRGVGQVAVPMQTMHPGPVPVTCGSPPVSRLRRP